jgi:hypothetical protein
VEIVKVEVEIVNDRRDTRWPLVGWLLRGGKSVRISWLEHALKEK